MPSTSPGVHTSIRTSSAYDAIFPGAPNPSLQGFASFAFRFKRYIAYISGSQLNLLSGPSTLFQTISFKHELVAIAAENQTGRLIVSDKIDVWILEPVTQGWTKVWWKTTLMLKREDAGDEACAMSWGGEGDVLVGGKNALSLFSALPPSRGSASDESPVAADRIEERRALWTKPTSSPVLFATFSPSAILIASCARYDRLVKIWRRLSFEEGLFDYTYLPHPATVTHLQWRPLNEFPESRRSSGLSGRPDDDPEVLFTICKDGILRIWQTGGTNDVHILVLFASLDLVSGIPESPSLVMNRSFENYRPMRYAFILPSDQFCAAANAAIGLPQRGEVNHNIEHLKEIVSKEPDVIVSLDGRGRMSAWGLQHVGHKRRAINSPTAEAFHLAHAENLPLIIPGDVPVIFQPWFQNDTIHLLAHSPGQAGQITWWQGDFGAFFAPSSSPSQRVYKASTWSGLDSKIVDVRASDHGLVFWSARDLSLQLTGSSAPRSISCASHDDDNDLKILEAVVLNEDGYILTILNSGFVVWNQEGSRQSSAAHKIISGGKARIISARADRIAGVFVQGSFESVLQWTVQFTQSTAHSTDVKLDLKTLALNGLHDGSNLRFAIPVVMPFSPGSTGIISCTQDGSIGCNLLENDNSSQSSVEVIAMFESGVTQPKVFKANEEFAAVVSKDSKQLTILDLTDGYIEYQEVLDQPIEQLECNNLQPRHNLLAIGFKNEIRILAQGRYGAHTAALPVWNLVKTISIDELGSNISRMAWTFDNGLAITAGNSVLFSPSEVVCDELNDDIQEAVNANVGEVTSLELPQLVEELQTPLPAWHPSQVSNLVYYGDLSLATFFLRRLAQQLRFWSNGDYLHPMLDQPPETLLDIATSNSELEDEVIVELKAQFEEKQLPSISPAEHQHLKYVLDVIAYVREHAKGLDLSALRFLFQWKIQLLRHENQLERSSNDKSNGGQSGSPFAPVMAWREIVFASHSSTQQPLLDILVLHYDNKLTWRIARNLGILAWLSHREALEHVFEQLAQSAYRTQQPPDPIDASLYFLALRKKSTLVALWRMAGWHQEQRKTMNFLRRDFSQADAQTAARKNAYALMGKRRFLYAAAFFLLADDPGSATSVLAGQYEDLALAIAVARLYSGDGSPVLRKLLEDRVLSQPKHNGDRWLYSWCYSVLFEKAAAAHTLVRPMDGVRAWNNDDPATLLLYLQLRDIPSEHEYDAVLRAARLLRKMGLWISALQLVGRWKFKSATPALPYRTKESPKTTVNGVKHNSRSSIDAVASPMAEAASEPPSLLGQFTQPESTAPRAVDTKRDREEKAAELLKKLKAKKATAPAPVTQEKKPTQFKEPDANSLLESFGF